MIKQKKILMLGGSYFQVPAIKYAKKAGYYVITCDYLPNNPGHKYADIYYNVSTTDEIAVLNLARKLNIDGIVSYASDPGASTAAYVAEKLNLPGNPYESVKILQQKDLFRNFLKENRFNIPEYKAFKKLAKAKTYAVELLKKFDIIVKPVDSSGSKGVSRLKTIKNFNDAFDFALNYSLSKKIVVEQFIEKNIYEMDGDGFVWNGKLLFRCFGNQHNDLQANPYVPAGISFPYIQNDKLQKKAQNEVERVLFLLNMKMGGLNIEYLTDNNDNIYILEIGPRNGGNLIPEVIKYATGIDLIAYAIEGSLGKDCSSLKMKKTNGFYSSYLLHSQKNGIVNNVTIETEIEKFIIEKNIWVNNGDHVNKFNGSNDTLGAFILQFHSQIQMMDYLDNMNDYIKINLR